MLSEDLRSPDDVRNAARRAGAARARRLGISGIDATTMIPWRGRRLCSAPFKRPPRRARPRARAATDPYAMTMIGQNDVMEGGREGECVKMQCSPLLRVQI